ncbi:hypothetical protein MAJHIDBO_01344 [Propionibacterium freudenreichii subsp. shermanii]|nr:hypothetical protein MAJHIDBO_01344 [Propionibacterium freudenreichii subsp. shermanii]SPS09139.1 hypothetical protein MAJHIDBO_01344 [Propionibacterium freudenreichii subsp. shermanii]
MARRVPCGAALPIFPGGPARIGGPVHHAVGRVGDDGVELALAEQHRGVAGVAGEHGHRQLRGIGDGPVAPGLLTGTGRGIQALAHHPPVATHRGHLGGVLEALATQIGLEEASELLERRCVELHPVGIVPGRPGGQQGGAASGKGIEHVELAARLVMAGGGVAAGGSRSPTGGHLAQRHVQQQAGEQLVGLAAVLGDGHQVVVQHVGARQLDGPQQHLGGGRGGHVRRGFTSEERGLLGCAPGELGRCGCALEEREHTRLGGDLARIEVIGLEGQVVDACHAALHGGAEVGARHGQLGGGQGGRLGGIDVVGRGREQHQVGGHVAHLVTVSACHGVRLSRGPYLSRGPRLSHGPEHSRARARLCSTCPGATTRIPLGSQIPRSSYCRSTFRCSYEVPLARSKEARISASASVRPVQEAPSTLFPGSRSL